MKIGFYPGSFDPFTNGHLHVVKQALKIFDKVIIGIGINPDKPRRFDREIMKKAIETTLKNNNLKNVEVICYDIYSGEIAIKYNCMFMIRGIRNNTDYNYEEKISEFNELNYNLDTIYIRAGKLGNISSSKVMKLLSKNQDVSNYLPLDILNMINNNKK